MAKVAFFLPFAWFFLSKNLVSFESFAHQTRLYAASINRHLSVAFPCLDIGPVHSVSSD